MNRIVLLLLGVFLVLCVKHAFAIEGRTNCGGNSAALAAVDSYVMIAGVEAMDSPVHTFIVTDAAPPQRSELVHLSGASELPRARFLVSTSPVIAGAMERRVIIVCDTAYTNVPRHWFWSTQPSHAVGYSDGSTGLLNSAEYSALDRSSFVALDELFASTPKSQEAAAPAP